MPTREYALILSLSMTSLSRYAPWPPFGIMPAILVMHFGESLVIPICLAYLPGPIAADDEEGPGSAAT